MKKLKIALSVVSVILLLVIGGGVLWIRNIQAISHSATIISSFNANYGNQAKLINFSKAKDLQLALRENGGQIHASLYIDGLWVELGVVGNIAEKDVPPTK